MLGERPEAEVSRKAMASAGRKVGGTPPEAGLCPWGSLSEFVIQLLLDIFLNGVSQRTGYSFLKSVLFEQTFVLFIGDVCDLQ